VKLTVAHLDKNSPPIIKPECSSPFSQEPATGPSLEPLVPRQVSDTPSFRSSLPPPPWSSERPPPLELPKQNFVHISDLPHATSPAFPIAPCKRHACKRICIKLDILNSVSGEVHTLTPVPAPYKAEWISKSGRREERKEKKRKEKLLPLMGNESLSSRPVTLLIELSFGVGFRHYLSNVYAHTCTLDQSSSPPPFVPFRQLRFLQIRKQQTETVIARII
jgi:hypothetical protein